ncbi:unnamed protein product [Arabis nemorensis]|uniref:Uncharacterized protein n=1 Tax=Arabis nemorensis TaxID=586526 RepID=A0A565BJ18_9BRAS|nr:unnamed protein product [Arabis nemorensis]
MPVLLSPPEWDHRFPRSDNDFSASAMIVLPPPSSSAPIISEMLTRLGDRKGKTPPALLTSPRRPEPPDPPDPPDPLVPPSPHPSPSSLPSSPSRSRSFSPAAPFDSPDLPLQPSLPPTFAPFR